MKETPTKEQNVDGGCCQNTDRHLWPQVSEPGAPHESLHITKDGALGINCSGYVYVKPIREWHRLAGGPFPAVSDTSTSSNLVIRLRALSQGYPTAGEAADEIERLARQRDSFEHQVDLKNEGLREQRSEIERLSRALRDTRAGLAACNQVLQQERSAHETSALPHASAALKDFMAHLGEIMSMEDGAAPADYLQRACEIREWCHDHQTPLNFVDALSIAEGVFEQYHKDQPKWWRRMDGTPILNDVAVRMAEAFRKHAMPPEEPSRELSPSEAASFDKTLARSPRRVPLRDSDAAFNLGVLPTEQPENGGEKHGR